MTVSPAPDNGNKAVQIAKLETHLANISETLKEIKTFMFDYDKRLRAVEKLADDIPDLKRRDHWAWVIAGVGAVSMIVASMWK